MKEMKNGGRTTGSGKQRADSENRKKEWTWEFALVRGNKGLMTARIT